MTTTNVYFSHGTSNEQYLIEDLIVESLKIYGQEVFYIPRTLVGKDEILGEDRLSEFKSSFPVEMYFENVVSFDGQGAFIQKFGLMMEQSATLVVARRRWEQMIGRHKKTILPDRPCEGDLIYFPLTQGLFEIKFVKHQDPFYQIGKLYVYKLQVELFQYASEKLNTGIPEIDVFESLKSFSTDTTVTKYGEVISVTITNAGSGYTSPPLVSFTSATGHAATAEAVIAGGEVTDIIITAPGYEYETAPTVVFDNTGTGGSGAAGTAVIRANIDKPDSFGDNNKFKTEAADLIFNTNNPFGDVET